MTETLQFRNRGEVSWGHYPLIFESKYLKKLGLIKKFFYYLLYEFEKIW